MKIRSSIATVGVGLIVGTGTLAAAGRSAVTASTPAQASGGHQELGRALKACARRQSKSERRSCEKSAQRHSRSRPKSEASRRGLSVGSERSSSSEPGPPGEVEPPGSTTTTATTTTGAPTTGPKLTASEELAMAATVSETPSPAAVKAGESLFEPTCAGCHGPTGEGNEGDGYVPFRALPRAQSVKGVIEDLVKPEGSFVGPNFDSSFSFAEKEALGDFICVELTKKCQAAN